MADAVKLYRQECRIERIFDRLNLVPMYVPEPDQITGLTHLLTLGIRVLTLIEFVVNRSLAREQTAFLGLHPENPRKTTARPTSERLLKAFEGMTLTIIHIKDQVIRHLSPLSEVQKDILKRLGLDSVLYQNLEIQKTLI